MNKVWSLVMTGLADVDRIKIYIQGYVLPGFRPMNMGNSNHRFTYYTNNYTH